eukprot:TRINITY_DN3657_c0_g1::TRINITY_DN3657_c0_g1_i1::g.9201::m.9201 TRINITY_DN3657_c0_g1::TRINITY_DN3657_c0_g1_i1::g.9201  ORF type:complete len:165 (-),score=1.73,zf-C3HC4_3/PF13920.1/9.4e-10,zf-C3HC4_2/PF13923.1/8.5e-08,zf-C3HC4/PF00097.20/6.9e+03,zf-C3HC4/PF00097.20/1.9e-06,zf-RING_2/PF13639.1/8.2e+03,zf-RING_2/PF13639.1/0.00011,zf-P11/PF03854.9/0.0025,PepSY_TM_2/PF13703.1/0.025,zf-RING_5/PF14634.1/6e+03,zf-RING_5/PF14634.1/0.019,DUF2627/PF11118.3/0.032,CcmD/PF04995.9/0.16 TRINITY_DN3657_c0_g1_i1:1
MSVLFEFWHDDTETTEKKEPSLWLTLQHHTYLSACIGIAFIVTLAVLIGLVLHWKRRREAVLHRYQILATGEESVFVEHYSDDSDLSGSPNLDSMLNRDPSTCIVCLTKTSEIVTGKCGHLGMCLPCSTQLLRGGTRCPVCGCSVRVVSTNMNSEEHFSLDSIV